MPKEEIVTITARVKAATKARLEAYCKGEIDGERHIQEDVVETALQKHLNFAAKLANIEKGTAS